MDYESFGSNLSSPPPPPPPLFANPNQQQQQSITIPNVQCRCGRGICYIRTSTTDKNPGRQFYKCPACGFFQWCDEPSSDQGVRVAVTPYPMCSCGAGVCKYLKVMKEGNNKGRFFFVCPVTKGQGACKFFQWEDEIKQSPVKEEEIGRSNSWGAHAKILSSMRNLRVSEESSSTSSPVEKPAGQWMKECFKCGETGHWMKDCTA